MPREGSLNRSTSSDIFDDLYTESLKDPDCVAILLNYIKKIEKQITQIKAKVTYRSLVMLWILLRRSLINSNWKEKREKKS